MPSYARATDLEEIEKPEQAVTAASISVERDLRKYLVMNLSSLEPSLKLYQDQERTGEEYSIEGGRIENRYPC